MKIIEWIKSAYLYQILAAWKHKRDAIKDPKKETLRIYRTFFKQDINWQNPRNLIEKIAWMELNSDTSLWTECADKYSVRDYVERNGFGSMLTKLYGHWGKAGDINFDILPNRFVLKTNHSCENTIIINNKSLLSPKDIHKIRIQLDRWLSIPYGYCSGDLHYTRIKPCIIAEEFLENSHKEISSSIIDYKIWCFRGIPESVWVAFNREKGKPLHMKLFDLSWQERKDLLVSSDHYIYDDIVLERPKSFNKMLEACRILSKPFPEVRVDFYDVCGKPYFGELTFSTGFGYFTEDYYNYLGDKTDISELINQNR